MAGNTSLRITAVALGLGIGTFAVQAYSQGAPAPGYQMAPPAAPSAPPRAPGMRDVFAATLAAVVQTTGVAAASAVSAGLNGAITGWLDKKQRGNYAGTTFYPQQPPGTYSSPPPPQGYPPTDTSGGTNPGYPNTGYPDTGGANPGYPGTGGANPGYPNTGYPDTGGANPGYPNTGNTGYPAVPGTGYPNTGAPGADGSYPNTGYPNTNTATPGYPGTPGANGGYPNTGGGTYPGIPGGTGQLYAGFAYEIHALGTGGYAQPVDPTTHAFRTGDRFKIVYRPSMPGQVDVYNINAAGQQSRIDTLNVAAGQLAELGPYEFANLKGNETLILSLSPCTTQALMTATRDIVKVPDAMSGTAGTFQLDQCDATITRGLKKTKTRDIRKVSVEGGTNFGLDALSATEIRSGDVDPRQITITLQHQ
jgi:hypothetical protein